MKIEDIYSLTKINPFFLNKILNIVDWEKKISKENIFDPQIMLKTKKMGFSDRKLADITGLEEETIRKPGKKKELSQLTKW